jgi:hypothetical protein
MPVFQALTRPVIRTPEQGRPATKRICGNMPGLPSAAGLRKLAGRA